MTFRILITGSRDWDDPVMLGRSIYRVINENCPMLFDEHGNPDRRDTSELVIVHGACPTGADAMARKFAQSYRPAPIRTEPHPARWDELGKRAGFERNAEMVSLGAHICLAFVNPCTSSDCRRIDLHGSHGTMNCANLARKAKIETRIINVRRITADKK